MRSNGSRARYAIGAFIYAALSGTSSSIRVSGPSQIRNAYLKFDLTGISSSFSSATLRVYCISGCSTTGFAARGHGFDLGREFDHLCQCSGVQFLDRWCERRARGRVEHG